MHDMIDSLFSPAKLGMISAEPRRLAKDARKAIRNFGVPTTVFIDRQGNVIAQPTAYAADHPVDEIVGIYGEYIDVEDIADDLRACVAPRLASIGILVHWQDACLHAS